MALAQVSAAEAGNRNGMPQLDDSCPGASLHYHNEYPTREISTTRTKFKPLNDYVGWLRSLRRRTILSSNRRSFATVFVTPPCFKSKKRSLKVEPATYSCTGRAAVPVKAVPDDTGKRQS